eukprot:scaffold1286_cov22-Prasinocladus_malaysianus.AAC.1
MLPGVAVLAWRGEAKRSRGNGNKPQTQWETSIRLYDASGTHQCIIAKHSPSKLTKPVDKTSCKPSLAP